MNGRELVKFKSRTGHHTKCPRSDELLGFFFVSGNFKGDCIHMW